MTAENEETMFTITTIPNNITIGRDLPPTSPAVRLDERGIQVNGARPLDLSPGESTIVEYPISERDETPIRRLRCKVTREFMYDDLVAAVRDLEKASVPLTEHVESVAEQKRAEFAALAQKAGDPGTTMLAVASTKEPASRPCDRSPSSLAATIERTQKASENAPVPRRGGRRSARRSES